MNRCSMKCAPVYPKNKVLRKKSKNRLTMNNKTRGRVRSKKLHQFDILYIFYLLKPDKNNKYLVFKALNNNE